MKKVLLGAVRMRGEFEDKKNSGRKIKFDNIKLAVCEYKPRVNDCIVHGCFPQLDIEKKPVFYKIPTRDFKEVSGIDPQHFLKNFERLYWLHKMEVLEKEDDYGKSIVVGLNFSVDHCTLLYKKLEANKPVGDFDESEVVEDFCNFDDESEDDDASAPASEENEDFEFEFLDRGTGEVGMKKKEVK